MSLVRQRTNQISLRGRVSTRDEASAKLDKAGDAVLVQRGQPRMLVLRCPCGCGDDLLINLDDRAGLAWRLYKNRRGTTLYPSYWRDSACGSHFIVWNDHIYWCWGYQDEADEWEVDPLIEEGVLAELSFGEFTHYYDLAERLQLIPWETLQACRQLVRKGAVVAGKQRQSGKFRLAV
jgi:Family of unknown function (DUF6527)